MIDLDQMENDARKEVSKVIKRVAKNVEKGNAASFGDARKHLEYIDQLLEDRKKLVGE